MRSFRLSVFVWIAALLAPTTLAQTTTPTIIGKWRSTKIQADKNDDTAPKAWQIEFKPDGSYTEIMDDGFGIAADHSGTYQIKGSILTTQESWQREGYPLTVFLKGDVLSLQSEAKPRWKVFFERSNEPQPELAKLPKTPRTLEEAVTVLRQVLKKKDLENIRDKKEADLIMLHHGLGTYIRNGFGLWRDNQQLREACGGPTLHPDSASMVIIKALWRDLKKNP